MLVIQYLDHLSTGAPQSNWTISWAPDMELGRGPLTWNWAGE